MSGQHELSEARRRKFRENRTVAAFGAPRVSGALGIPDRVAAGSDPDYPNSDCLFTLGNPKRHAGRPFEQVLSTRAASRPRPSPSALSPHPFLFRFLQLIKERARQVHTRFLSDHRRGIETAFKMSAAPTPSSAPPAFRDASNRRNSYTDMIEDMRFRSGRRSNTLSHTDSDLQDRRMLTSPLWA